MSGGASMMRGMPLTVSVSFAKAWRLSRVRALARISAADFDLTPTADLASFRTSSAATRE